MTGQQHSTERHESSASATGLLFLLMALVASAGAWMYLAELDMVSVAEGEVIPSTNVKYVQHLEGGILSNILVKEGEQVRAEQPLFELESTSSMADVEELQVRLNGLSVDLFRLEAESSGAEQPAYPAEFKSRHTTLVTRSQMQFEQRRFRYQSERYSQQEQIKQKEQEIGKIRARIASLHPGLELIGEQISISEDLLKDELTNRYNHLSLLRERETMQGQLEEDLAGVGGAESALVEARQKYEQIRYMFEEEARRELEESRRQHSELSKRMNKLQDSLQRTTLRSPVDGVVKTLNIYTVGGVVKAGEVLAEVVPAGDQLIVEARLLPQDVGYVEVDQLAQVRLQSSDAMRLGKLDGRVIFISPDTMVPQEGDPYYRVRVETERSYFERGDLRYHLLPGMQVTTSIITGKRTVLDYLLSPFLDSMEESMRER